MFERPPIDWSKPVRFNSGETCTAERVDGFILVEFSETPAAIKDYMSQKVFKESLVVHEHDGTIVGYDDMSVWVENVDRETHPIEAMFGMF